MAAQPVSKGGRRGAILGVVAAMGLGAVLVLPQSEPAPVADTVATPVVAAEVAPEVDLFEMAAPLERVETKLRNRETLSGLIDRLDIPARDGALALASLTDAELLDARRVRPGLEVAAHFEGETLKALSIEPEPGRKLLTKLGPDGAFFPVEMTPRLTEAPLVVKGNIRTSLYNDARQLGASDQQIVDFAQIFSYDVDFQREIHPGDTFEIVFDTKQDERGTVIDRGAVLYAALNGKAVDKQYYRFTTPDEKVTDYFQTNGESATKFLMKTPINGARLSSHFGKRRHPISGYTRLHKGTDFAAPTGTPIYAAGHGTVERASRYGGYGHYVRIRHANGYKTAYAHMSRYGRGIKAGRKVRQGQVIGYVGSTGASTGPHLHYEVYINGKPVNAMRLKLPTGRKLAETPEIMDAFEQRRDQIDAVRGLSQPPEFAILAAGTAATQ
ncbi:MAG: M23 family metallopeptidase [Henriciella sp.]|nr:M23 family metallopeptidase [Henriciella sp.]